MKLKKRRVIIVQLGENLLHDRFSVQHCLCAYTELLTIAVYGSHLAIIQIDDLPMSAHKGFLLLLQIFGIYALRCLFLLLCHDSINVQAVPRPKFRAKLAYLWNILVIFVPNMNFSRYILVRI